MLAQRAVASSNALDKGECARLTYRRRMKDVGHEVRVAWGQVHSHILGECARLNTARRGLVLTGVDMASSLVKRTRAESYHRVARTKVVQEPLVAECIDEPDNNRVVDMLSALGPEEAAYYSSEHNLVDWSGKSLEQFKELQTQYGFVGGTQEQYRAHFLRTDLPKDMWTYMGESDVKSIAGVSTVAKKRPATNENS